jgi:hypothetical protein
MISKTVAGSGSSSSSYGTDINVKRKCKGDFVASNEKKPERMFLYESFLPYLCSRSRHF